MQAADHPSFDLLVPLTRAWMDDPIESSVNSKRSSKTAVSRSNVALARTVVGKNALTCETARTVVAPELSQTAVPWRSRQLYRFEDIAMATTLIGVFNTFEDAKIAAGRLAQDGVARKDVRVHSRNRDIGFWDDAIEDEVTRTPPAYHSLVDLRACTECGVAQFFEFFLGGDDQVSQESHLHETLQRGGALLAVDVRDESRVNAVWAALNGAGAVEVAAR